MSILSRLKNKLQDPVLNEVKYIFMFIFEPFLFILDENS